MSPSDNPTDRLVTRLMVALTFGTGVVDAASYLGLHRVFIANMTGNVVFIGLGLAGHDDLPVARSLTALLAFAAGAFVAGRIQRGTDPARRVPVITVRLFAAVTGLLVALGLAFALWRPDGLGLDVLTVPFAMAMGIQAAAARRLAVADVSTVVVTSTLASLAADSRFAGRQPARQTRRLLAVLAMAAGALVGALLLRLDIVVPLVLAAAVVAVVTVRLDRLARAGVCGPGRGVSGRGR